MKEQWNKMTPAQKAWLMVECVLAVIMIVLAILEVTGIWNNQLFLYMSVVYFLVEAVRNWNRNRKLVIMDLVFAVILLIGVIL